MPAKEALPLLPWGGEGRGEVGALGHANPPHPALSSHWEERVQQGSMTNGVLCGYFPRMDFGNALILVSAGLVLLSIFAGTASARVGAPLLLVFLALGMLAGEDGPGGL